MDLRLKLGKRRNSLLPHLIILIVSISLTFIGYYLLFYNDDFDHSLARSLLRLGLPATTKAEYNQTEPYSLRSVIYLLTNYDLQDPLALLRATLPVSPRVTGQLRVWEERPFVFIQELSFDPDPVRPDFNVVLEAEKQPPSDLGVPKVLIYHTHTSEMYLGKSVPASQSNQAHYKFRNLADPTITGVMTVGRHLSKALNSLGIATLHETSIHTLPSINNSYANSEKTVREILGQGHDLDLVIDLHRDAGVPNPSLMINGRSVARLVLVIGTAERIPLAHPNFQENLNFATQIKNVCDEMYPGLMRPIQIQRDARYNQHLHPQSVIMEIGSVENTLEEALLAAELLANVLARVLPK